MTGIKGTAHRKRAKPMESLWALIDYHGDEWKTKASCKGLTGPRYDHVWFPVSYMSEASPEAKEVCSSCPVQRECLFYGLDLDKRHDTNKKVVFGGYVYAERRRLFPGGVVPRGKLPR